MAPKSSSQKALARSVAHAISVGAVGLGAVGVVLAVTVDPPWPGVVLAMSSGMSVVLTASRRRLRRYETRLLLGRPRAPERQIILLSSGLSLIGVATAFAGASTRVTIILAALAGLVILVAAIAIVRRSAR